MSIKEYVKDIIDYIKESRSIRIGIISATTVALIAVVMVCIISSGKKQLDSSDVIITGGPSVITVDDSNVSKPNQTGDANTDSPSSIPIVDGDIVTGTDGDSAESDAAIGSNASGGNGKKKINSNDSTATNNDIALIPQVVTPVVPTNSTSNNGNSNSNNSTSTSVINQSSTGNSDVDPFPGNIYAEQPTGTPDPVITPDSSMESDANDGENWSANDLD